MGLGRKKGSGAGGAALNFKVVPGLTQPGMASENTIWVKTEGLTSWYFAATQPENMQEGEVWFLTGTDSAVEFNALKKGTVQVYPLRAKQMVDGALVDLEAKSYQNGEWVDWFKYIVQGGIAVIGFNTHVRNADKIAISKDSSFIKLKCTAYADAVVSDTKIDLTNVSKIVADIDVIKVGKGTSSVYGGTALIITQKINQSSVSNTTSALVTTSSAGRQHLELDVTSVTGSYYVGIGLDAHPSYTLGEADVYNLSYV